MADFPAPVPTQVNPNQGLDTFSRVLGMAGQAQQLRATTADADQAQQKNRELTALSQLIPNAVKSGRWATSEGEFDNAKASADIAAVAPVYGGDAASSLLSRARDAVLTRESLLKLSDEQRASEAQSWASLAGDQDLSKTKIIDEVARRIDTAPTPGMKRTLLSTLAHMPNTDDPQQLRAFANRVSIAAGGNYSETPSSIDTGATIQPGATNKFTGAFTPSGPGIKKELAPTEQLPYVRARGAAGTEGSQGAANDEALYNDIVQKGTKATQLKALTQDIRALASEVQTGQYSKAMADKWSALKQTFGFRPDDDSFETKRQILSKMAAQLRTQSEAGASTDAERQGISAALPDPEHMGPAAVAQAARYVGALSDVQAARARLANQHRQVNGGKSTGIRESDSAFMQNADPRVFEYQSIPPGAERQAYLKQHFKTKEDVKAFLDKQAALKGYGAIQ